MYPGITLIAGNAVKRGGECRMAGNARYVTHSITRDRLLLETKVSNGEKVTAALELHPIEQISGCHRREDPQKGEENIYVLSSLQIQ